MEKKQTSVQWLINHWTKLQKDGEKMTWQQIIDITNLALQMEREQIEEEIANAKLIAAAPELLKVIERARLSIMAHPDYTGEENDEWTDLVDSIDEAIKKATE